MTFSEKLIRLRKREGVSQEELAAYLEVSRQAVSRWEQGTALPDAGNLLKLRQRFGVSVDWLLEDAKSWEAQADRPVAPEASEEAVPKVRKSVLPWAIPLGISTLGLLLLGIFASVFPAEYVIGAAMEVGKEARPPEVYTGLAGFLKCNNLFWLFWLCVIVAIGSLAAGIWQAAAWNRIETEREPADGEKKE
ncbi:MAG: helix-turn-helix transcriptional regulator [Oscillibacter sp.]|nr:helix-turn-helix transcriptional regulator [Dysosmobacter sp.]MDD6409700.1 helix-turn-helix transcriptional regulator [Oscillibacter sp.]MDY3866832.1 helix-turn-helix transcriptional regulator [Dysosmobacter sp.]